MKRTILQLIKFGIVGACAAIVDVGVLVALRELLKLDVLLSSAVSFSVSVVVNYFLSMRFVFKGKEQEFLREFLIFVALSVGGLGLNQLIMWLGVKYLPLHYLGVKLFAMIFVPVYNFVTRKIFLEEKEVRKQGGSVGNVDKTAK